MRRLLTEPLLHFFVLGALIFALWSAVAPPEADPPVAGTAAPGEAERALLVAQFEAVWRRQPTEEELAALIGRQAEQNVLVAEARALGLDRDDAVIRQRLEQKMRMLIEGQVAPETPDAETLRAYFEANADSYRVAPRLTLEQVPIRSDASAEEIEAALDTGRIGGLVQPSLLPTHLEDVSPGAIDGTFGAGFAAALDGLEPGPWQGPVESAYGRHVVRLIRAEPGRLPDLAEISGRVAEDWRREETSARTAQVIDALRDTHGAPRP